MAADNSLTWNGDFGNKNLGQIVRAMDGLKGNMLVYIDLPSEGATLYKIEGDGKTKTVVEKYGVENSVSTEVLQRVLNTSMQSIRRNRTDWCCGRTAKGGCPRT